jgi:hypothetical protein
MFLVKGSKGKIEQISSKVCKVTVTDDGLKQELGSSSFTIPMKDLDTWMEKLDVTSNQDDSIRLGSWW